jgi:hypothetical protein
VSAPSLARHAQAGAIPIGAPEAVIALSTAKLLVVAGAGYQRIPTILTKNLLAEAAAANQAIIIIAAGQDCIPLPAIRTSFPSSPINL